MEHKILKMQDPLRALTDQERFVRNLLSVYKEQPVLWNKNHPHYRNRAERNEAHEVLLQKCREYYPEADEDFVKIKIDSLRATFRKEWNKVCFSKASAERPEDVYKPSLWYYNLLLYTVGEECLEDDNGLVDTTRMFWNREYTTILIGLLKKHPCLYVNSSVAGLARRNGAIKQITEEMDTYTGKLFTPDNIRRKIQLLKGQYRFECRKIKERRKINPKSTYKSNLWCFEMLGFLKGHVFKKSVPLKNDSRKPLRRSGRIQTGQKLHSDVEELQNVKKEVNVEQYEDELYNNCTEKCDSTNGVNAVNDDIFDTIGKNVAWKLRDMTDDQRKYAEKLVNELMYHGQMENLTSNSRLSVDGT